MKTYAYWLGMALLALSLLEARAGIQSAISLPNDTNQCCPWAGKILTGDENNAILYTIATERDRDSL